MIGKCCYTWTEMVVWMALMATDRPSYISDIMLITQFICSIQQTNIEQQEHAHIQRKNEILFKAHILYAWPAHARFYLRLFHWMGDNSMKLCIIYKCEWQTKVFAHTHDGVEPFSHFVTLRIWANTHIHMGFFLRLLLLLLMLLLATCAALFTASNGPKIINLSFCFSFVAKQERERRALDSGKRLE